jgi:hypothetical protein
MAVSGAASKTVAALEDRFEASPLIMLRILAASAQYGKIRTVYAYQDAGGTSSRGDVTLLCNGVGREFAVMAALDSPQSSASSQVFLNQERLAFKTSRTDGSLYGITFDTYDRDIGAYAPASGLDADTVGALTDAVAFLNSAMRSNQIAAYEDYAWIIENLVMNLTPAEARESIALNGDTVSCKAVSLVLTESVVKQLARDLYNVLKEDVKDSPSLAGLKTLAAVCTGTSWQDGPSGTPAEELAQLLSYFESKYRGSIDVTCYISGGALVRCAASVPNMKDSGRLLVTADFGRNPETDDLSLTIRDQAADGDVLCGMTLETDDGPLGSTNLLTLSDGTDTAAVKTVWQKKTGALALDMKSPGMSISGSGALTLAAGAFTLEFNDLRVNDHHLILSLSAEKGVTVPSPAYINLDSWSKDFLE